jgi:thiol-disulfide isomerase/thioredoxin
VQKEVNEGGETKRLGLIYVGWDKYNEACDHDKLYAMYREQFYGLLDPSQVVKDKLSKLVDQVRAPHVVVLSKKEDGSIDVVLDDPGTKKIQEFQAKGYPWSDSRIEELKAAEKARLAEIKQKQTNLQFLKGENGRDGLFTNDGTEVKVDTLASKGGDAVVGIYFSAHWCPPCRGFTPQLAKCYTELKDAGKDFQVVFVSSDKDEESFKEYMQDMPWVAVPFAERDLKKDLNSAFEVQGIPTLILLKPDGTLITSNGREAVDYGAEYFPWGSEELEKGQADAKRKADEKKTFALEKEIKDLEAQAASGGPVLKRLRGTPGTALSHDLVDRTVSGNEFATIGAPNLLATAGVIYYEIEVVSSRGVPQIGFAGSSFAPCDQRTGEGVGDDAESWGFDGTRKLAWFEGGTGWDVEWANGDVIGFAANIEEGKIAVSKNGAWEPSPLGVFFTNEAIKSGVYPCMTLQGYTVRYNLDGSGHGPFKHGPPTSWSNSAGYPQ